MSSTKQVLKLEREFWQQAFCSAASSNNHDLESKGVEHTIPHYGITADHAVNEWRQRFAPERVGEPIEGELERSRSD